jgi:hypothetical protein
MPRQCAEERRVVEKTGNPMQVDDVTKADVSRQIRVRGTGIAERFARRSFETTSRKGPLGHNQIRISPQFAKNPSPSQPARNPSQAIRPRRKLRHRRIIGAFHEHKHPGFNPALTQGPVEPVGRLCRATTIVKRAEV